MKYFSPILIAVFSGMLFAPLTRAQSAEVQQLYQQAHEAQQAGNNEKAIASYRELLRKDPSIAPAYNNLGRLYFGLNRFDEAATVLKQGLRINPEMHPAQAMLGASLYYEGHATEAIAPLKSAAAAMPDDHFVHVTLAHALLAAARKKEAVSLLQQMTASDPKDQESWYLLGKIQLDESRESFARVQAIDPDSVIAHTLAGEIMESMSNTPGAITEYKKALASHPDDATAQEHLASAYWDAGDWQPALDAYKVVLTRAPSNCTAHWKVSKALNELSAPVNEAIEQAKVATTLCPKLAPAYLEEARARLRDNQAAPAVSLLKQAEALTPDEPSIQALLARAYRAQGQTAEATAATQKFAALTAAEHAHTEQHAAEVLGANSH